MSIHLGEWFLLFWDPLFAASFALSKNRCKGRRSLSVYEAFNVLLMASKPLFVEGCSFMNPSYYLLSDSLNNERQHLQRRQWKVHISWRCSHSVYLSRFSKMFSLERPQWRGTSLILLKFCVVFFPQQKLQKPFPERDTIGLEIGA